jgi:hypothetical protein
MPVTRPDPGDRNLLIGEIELPGKRRHDPDSGQALNLTYLGRHGRRLVLGVVRLVIALTIDLARTCYRVLGFGFSQELAVGVKQPRLKLLLLAGLQQHFGRHNLQVGGLVVFAGRCFRRGFRRLGKLGLLAFLRDAVDGPGAGNIDPAMRDNRRPVDLFPLRQTKTMQNLHPVFSGL